MPGQCADHEHRLEALERLVWAMSRRGEWKLRCGENGEECHARTGWMGPGQYGADCPQYSACMAELRELLCAGGHHG